MPEQIAFIGAGGGMGRLMAANLASWIAAQGHPKLVAWNRTASKLKSLDCKIATSLADVAAADVVISSLANDAAAESVYTELLSHVKSKTLIIETSTLYPDFVAELEQRVNKVDGATFVSAPVFGAPAAAKAGKLVFVFGGSEEGRQLAAKVCVPSMGDRSMDVGEDVKKAASLKLCGNSLIAGLIEIIAEAQTLGDKCGVGRGLVHQFIEQFIPAPSAIGCAWTASARLTDADSTRMLNNNFESESGFAAPNAHKDLRHIRSLAAQHGATMPTADTAYRNLTTAMANGDVKLDWSSMVVAQRLAAGLKGFE